jgi:hypothetical protein
MDAVPHETNSPWPTWVAADGTQSYRSPYADEDRWPDSVTAELFGAILSAWRGGGTILIHSAPYVMQDGERVYQELDALNPWAGGSSPPGSAS